MTVLVIPIAAAACVGLGIAYLARRGTSGEEDDRSPGEDDRSPGEQLHLRAVMVGVDGAFHEGWESTEADRLFKGKLALPVDLSAEAQIDRVRWWAAEPSRQTRLRREGWIA